jgi:chemotaxis protein histidine kinase CheA
LLQQFISEAKDFLQGINEKLMQLEDPPSDAAMMDGLPGYTGSALWGDGSVLMVLNLKEQMLG